MRLMIFNYSSSQEDRRPHSLESENPRDGLAAPGYPGSSPSLESLHAGCPGSRFPSPMSCGPISETCYIKQML